MHCSKCWHPCGTSHLSVDVRSSGANITNSATSNRPQPRRRAHPMSVTPFSRLRLSPPQQIRHPFIVEHVANMSVRAASTPPVSYFMVVNHPCLLYLWRHAQNMPRHCGRVFMFDLLVIIIWRTHVLNVITHKVPFLQICGVHLSEVISTMYTSQNEQHRTYVYCLKIISPILRRLLCTAVCAHHIDTLQGYRCSAWSVTLGAVNCVSQCQSRVSHRIQHHPLGNGKRIQTTVTKFPFWSMCTTLGLRKYCTTSVSAWCLRSTRCRLCQHFL